jgi:aminopeptidase N
MIALLLALALTSDVPHPLRPLPPSMDVRSYDVDIMMSDPLSKRIDRGVQRVVVYRMSSTDTLFPFHLRSLVIDSVLVNGTRSSYRTIDADNDTTTCHVVPMQPMLIETFDTVDIHYHGTMTSEAGSFSWGGVHAEDSVLYALGVGFNNPYVSATQHWMPVLDHPGDKATFRGRFTVPEGYVVASVGTLTNTTTLTGTSTFTWVMDEPSATYLLTFGVGRFVAMDLAPSDTLDHVAYVLPRDTASARVSMKLVPRMRAAFERWFGPYPFGKVGYMSTVKGAMEHQTMIALNTSLVQRRDSTNGTAAHELAHQWFGDLVTPTDFRHVWLTESFATYCESLWTEDLFGYPAYLTSLDQRRQRYRTQIAPREGVMPLYDFPRAAPSSNYPETIYQKGAVVLGMVRTWFGDSTFRTAMRSFLDRHRYGNATTDDMQQALEDASGLDLEAFFDDWIRKPGWPRLTVTMQRLPTAWKATITQVQRTQQPTWPQYRQVPLPMTYRDPQTGRDIDTVLVMGDTPLELMIDDPASLRINAGMKGRSLVEVVSTTSVDAEAHATYAVAPNPAGSIITITSSGARHAEHVRIYDGAGRLAASMRWPSGEQRCTLDVHALATGVYMIDLQGISMPLIIER